MPDLSRITGFQWDQGNKDKNWIKHRVSNHEAEDVFFNRPLVLPNPKHSVKERRYYALGETSQGRILFISFTIRQDLIRVISARDANKKEKQKYYAQKKKHS